MDHQLEPGRSRPPLLHRAVALVVLIVVAALAVHIVIGLVMTVIWILAAIVVVAAAIWALNTIL